MGVEPVAPLGNPQQMARAIDEALDLIHEWRAYARRERDIGELAYRADLTIHDIEEVLEDVTEAE